MGLIKIESLAPAAPVLNLPLRLKSRHLDVATIQRVCICLGPYRNLTTLTASLLALHPDVVVLNHAGWRVFSDASLNFLARPERQRVERFCRFAALASRGGKRGDFGGAIEKSHAFDRAEMAAAHREARRQAASERIPRCVFWKESLRTSNFLHEHPIDFDALFRLEPAVVFLMPVRFPLDCAASNLRTGHSYLFRELGSRPTLNEMTDAVLEELRRVLALKARYPERVKLIYEDEFAPSMFEPLARFLALDDPRSWAASAAPAVKLSSRHSHPPDAVEYFRHAVAERLHEYPEVATRLLAMA